MYLNVIKTPKGNIVAICDQEHIEKTLKQGDIVLDIKKHSNFYKGKIANENEIINAMQNADSLNLVGERCINIAHSLGKITKNQVLIIEGIPHIQVYKI